MSHEIISKETINDDLMRLSTIFKFSFDVTDNLPDNAKGMYTLQLSKFLGILDVKLEKIEVRPYTLNEYDDFLATFLHELGHLIDHRIHGHDSPTVIKEMVATMFSAFVVQATIGYVSPFSLQQILSTTNNYKYCSEHKDVCMSLAFECVKFAYDTLTEKTVLYTEFENIIDSHMNVLKEMGV